MAVTYRNLLNTERGPGAPVTMLLAELVVLGAGAVWTPDGELRVTLPVIWCPSPGDASVPLPPAFRAQLWGAMRHHRAALRAALVDARLAARWPGVWAVLPAAGVSPPWRCAIALYTALARDSEMRAEPADVAALLNAEGAAAPVLVDARARLWARMADGTHII